MPEVIWEHRGFRIVKTDVREYWIEDNVHDALDNTSWRLVKKLSFNAAVVGKANEEEWLYELLKFVEAHSNLACD